MKLDAMCEAGLETRELEDGRCVSFSFPCLRDYGPSSGLPIPCPHEDDGHGHVILEGDDGYNVVWFRIFSRAGLERTLAVLLRHGIIDEDQRRAASEIMLTRALAWRIHAVERVLLMDEERVAASACTGWWSI